jgi:hypothetical protein
MRMAAVRQERAVGNKARQVEQEGWLGFEGLGVSGFVSEEGAARRGEGAEGEEGRGDEDLTSAGEIAMKTPRPSAAFNLSTH